MPGPVSGGRVFVLRFVVGVLDTNMYLVYDGGTGDAVLVDAGGDPSEALEWVSRLGLRLRAVLATHGHFDHVLGIPRLGSPRPPAYIHGADLPIVELSLGWYSRYFGGKAEAPGFDVLLEGDARLELGSLVLEVIHTPGHSPGSVSVYAPAAGALFSGDTLFSGTVGRTDLPGGSEGDLAESIRRLYRRVPLDTVVYPGHGPPTTLRRELRANPFVEDALGGARPR